MLELPINLTCIFVFFFTILAVYCAKCLICFLEIKAMHESEVFQYTLPISLVLAAVVSIAYVLIGNSQKANELRLIRVVECLNTSNNDYLKTEFKKQVSKGAMPEWKADYFLNYCEDHIKANEERLRRKQITDQVK